MKNMCAQSTDCYSFNVLPREVKLIIFKHIIPKELQTVSLVCKEWHDLSYDPILWKVFELSKKTFIPVFQEIIKRLTLTKQVDMNCCDNVNKFLDLFSKNCPMLEVINMSDCNEADFKSLCNIAIECEFVKSVTFERLTDTEPEALQALAKFHNLTHLSLFDCRILNDEALINISKSCKKLVDVNIDQVDNLTDLSVAALIKECCFTLRRLLLDGEMLTDASYSLLHLCTHLRVLGISYAYSLGEEGIESIASLKWLLWLKIAKCEASSNTFLKLFCSDRSFPLIHLDLSDCSQINNECVERVVLTCPLLRCFSISWSYLITEEGVSKVLKFGKNIRCLTLLGLIMLNGDFLWHIVEEMPNLSFLNVQECNQIEECMTNSVKRLRPSMQVIDSYGYYVSLDHIENKFSYFTDTPLECVDSKLLMNMNV